MGPIVEAAAVWQKAGFTDLALVQIGDRNQPEFLDWAASELLPALRKGSS